MQRTFIRHGVLLAGAFTVIASLAAQQPQPHDSSFRVTEENAAITFNLERVQVAQTASPSFWLKGSSLDAAVVTRSGLGLAANVTGGHASTTINGNALGKVAFMAGPRYTARIQPRTEVFGEALFGGVHAFDSIFPGKPSATSSANAFSMQAGGGIDIHLAHGFGVRALEAGWVHTTLPNNAQNTQNDIRLALGLSWKR
jgi:hypothetical protein